jgi:protein-S-isoprenylcysteine O-methyltransferase Ste14
MTGGARTGKDVGSAVPQPETRPKAGQPSWRAAVLPVIVFRLAAGMAVIGGLLLWPAGTFNYPQAWIYLAVLFVPVLLLGGYLYWKDPELLERRMRTGETENPQKRVIGVFVVLLLVLYLVPGFDHRYGWSQVPMWLSLFADVVILAGYVLFILTIRENRFASRIIEVQQGQSVVTTGPYALVRHPMYLAVILIFGLTPLALGSYWGLLPALTVPILLAKRIENEEQLLRRDLGGYEAYTRKVRFRMVPFIW